MRIVIIVLYSQHVWFHVSHGLTDCLKLTIWYQTTRMSLLVVFALSCDQRNNSEVRRVLTVLFPTVHPQMNSQLDSWWLAHGDIRHRHMTNSSMDFSGMPDNGFD